ncbi:MAG: cation-translocating P-type ATPase [Burkholderiales bacterium]|nr:cation-translocating P-type ATPase [Burkholderiales bacterium]
MLSSALAPAPPAAGVPPLDPAPQQPAVAPSAPTPFTGEDLRLLDDPQEWSAFSRPSARGPQCWESNVVIEGMHCAACSLTVEEALTRVPGVISAQVGAASHRAKVVWTDQQVLPSAWMAAVQGSGYRAVPANDVFASERRKQETRQALWRWLVAGLCTMQVGMYAYPAYVARVGDLTAEMEQLLRWASWVLTLPVILFSCGPFFRNAWRDITQMRVSMDLPVALGMVITFAMSTAGTFEPTGIFGHEVYFDSLTMFVFFLLTGRWLELRLRDRTAGSLEALMNRLPDSVERLAPDGSFERVAVRRVVVGDVLRVHPGETFAADGVVHSGATQVDEALLTGESHPLARGVGAQVLSGSHNLSSTVQVRVERVGDSTRFAQIVALMESAAATKPQGAMLADRLAKPFLIGVLFASAAACAWWWGRDPGHALMVAVAVLVVTCPCALSLATPAAMLASAGALARQGVLVRRLQALEALAAVDTLVFDKTGTLTRDAMVLGAITARPGLSADDALAMAASLASHSLHPVSRALAAAQTQKSATANPWSCEAVTEQAGLGVSGRAVDARVTASAGVALRLGSAQFCGPQGDQATARGLCAYLADAQGWLATFELTEDLRPEAAAAVAALAAHGVEVHMLSGDSADSVARVAAQAGIARARGGCSPDDKLVVMRDLQAQGRSVAMVGDGLNDGPVLAGANVSFTFGRAVPLAQSKADFVILGEQLMRVVQALVLSRRTLSIVRQNLWWALIYNAACVPLAVAGLLPAWLAGLGMATSSLLVVLNALRLARVAPLEKVL